GRRDSRDHGRRRAEGAFGRDVQRREPRWQRVADEVRRARRRDRQRAEVAGHPLAGGDTGLERRDKRRRRRRGRYARPAPRRDRRGRWPDVLVATDQPGGRPGRRPAGREHSRGLLLPRGPGRRVRPPPGRRLPDRDRGRHRPRREAAADAQPWTRRAHEHGVEREPQAARRRVHVSRSVVLRDHEPLQLQGRSQSALPPLPPPRPRARGALASARAASGRAGDGGVNFVVLGALNDFECSQTMGSLTEGGILNPLMSTLPQDEWYSYVFEGNSQSLDHIVVSDRLFTSPFSFDPVHVNAEFANQLSDHDPQVARFLVNTSPSVSAGGPYSVDEGSSITLTASGSDAEDDALTYAWDLDDNGTFETAGKSATYSAVDGPAAPTVEVQVSDGTATATDTVTVTIANVPPTATLSAPTSREAGLPFPISLRGG